MAKTGKKRKAAAGDIATNRQASYRFEFLDKLECGVVLQGTEVKSLREGSAQLKDGYASIRLGDPIGVRVRSVDPPRGRVDLDPAEALVDDD